MNDGTYNESRMSMTIKHKRDDGTNYPSITLLQLLHHMYVAYSRLNPAS